MSQRLAELLASLPELKRRFAMEDVAEGQSGAEVAARAGYGGTAASRRRAAHRNRADERVAEATGLLRRIAAGESVEDLEADEDSADGPRQFRWVSNGRGPERADTYSSADETPFDEGGPWAPQPGPQTAFARCEADVAFYGGSAGSGKSFAALYELGKWTDLPRYRGIIFRRTTRELTKGGGLWDESQALYRDLGGTARSGNQLDWRFPSGARIEFSHMQRESDRFGHHGAQYAVAIFDEVAQFTSTQFWYLVSRLRSTSGVRPYVRGTCNPDPDSFVAKLIEWWIGEDGYPIPERSGVQRWFVRSGDDLTWFDSREAALERFPDSAPMSFTFIAARLRDNQILLEQDPAYLSKLKAMTKVDRERLLGDEERGGNWKVRESAGLIFARANFQISHKPPSPVVRWVRAWDKGSTRPNPKNRDPDWTRGVLMGLCEDGEIWIEDLVSLREDPAGTLAEMRQTATLDGVDVPIGIWEDQGGAGKVDVSTTVGALAGFSVEELASAEGTTRGLGGRGKAKIAWAKAWASWVKQRRVWVRRAAWTDELVSECDAFPDGSHDDIVDAISRGAQMLLHEQGTSLIEAMAKVSNGW